MRYIVANHFSTFLEIYQKLESPFLLIVYLYSAVCLYQILLGHKEVLSKSSQPAMKQAAQSVGGKVQPVFDQLSSLINEDIVKKIGAVYAFDISGEFSAVA